MPRVKLPDGNYGNFPDSMAPADIEAVLQKQFPADSEPPRIEIRGTSADEPSLRDTIVNAAQRVGGGALKAGADLATGLTTGAGQVGAALISPVDLGIDAATGRPLGTGNRERRAAIEAYGKERGDPDSINYQIANAAPEIIETGGPIAGAGRAIAGHAFVKSLGKVAPALGEVAANAAYSGGKAVGEGADLSDAATAAAYGGGGAAAARLGGNALGRATSGITDEAKQLIERGIVPTPGQAAGPGLVRSMEKFGGQFPLVGGAIDRAKTRAMRQYTEAEIDAAVKGLGIPTEGSGFKAVRELNDAIDASYNAVKPQTFWTPDAASTGLLRAGQEIERIPLLTDQQKAGVLDYIQTNIVPTVQKAKAAGTRIDGDTAKRIDTELGKQIRRYRDDPLGDAFQTLQLHLRDVLDAAEPGALQRLRATNDAYRKMIPINAATDRATSSGGNFTPSQFRSATERAGMRPGSLNDAARETLDAPSGGFGSALSRNFGIPGVGLGGAAYAGIPPHIVAAATAGTGAVANLAYTQPGVRIMLGAMNLPAHIRSWVEKLAPEKQAEFFMRMTAEDPSTRELAAQVGRHIATQIGARQ